MKIYMLIPFVAGDAVEIKDPSGYVSTGNLVREYSKRFGEKNKYYIDRSWETIWEMSGSKSMYCDDRQKHYYYDVFRPCDITRR